MKLVIDRNTWLRGEDNSKLLRKKDLKMCCLGFFCKSLGLSDHDIISVGTPKMVLDRIHPMYEEKVREALFSAKLVKENTTEHDTYTINTSVSLQLISYNDKTQGITEEQREEIISNLFREIDVEVKFIN